MALPVLAPPTKTIRARLVADEVEDAGWRGVVCFSCGNASRALKEAVPYVVAVAPGGDLVAARWWTPAEVHRAWPDLLDATSGHLPAHLMIELSTALRDHVGQLREPAYRVPTGSGETIVCLRMAYPGTTFVAVYDDNDPATLYDYRAPLVALVKATGPVLRVLESLTYAPT
jgi:hypothetical protein